MADRDIQSVPVTTLAGLASVSDCKLQLICVNALMMQLQ